MISVLVLGSSTASGRPATSGDAVRSLSALVAGTVEGVFRDVHLLATAAGTDLAEVAEHAGCSYGTGPLPEIVARAVAAARSPFVLVLLAGVSFDRALTDEMAETVAHRVGWLAGGVALRAVESGALGRLLPRFAATAGVLTTRDRLRGTQAARVPALWRTLRPRRSFKTRAWTGDLRLPARTGTHVVRSRSRPRKEA